MHLSTVHNGLALEVERDIDLAAMSGAPGAAVWGELRRANFLPCLDLEREGQIIEVTLRWQDWESEI